MHHGDVIFSWFVSLYSVRVIRRWCSCILASLMTLSLSLIRREDPSRTRSPGTASSSFRAAAWTSAISWSYRRAQHKRGQLQMFWPPNFSEGTDARGAAHGAELSSKKLCLYIQRLGLDTRFLYAVHIGWFRRQNGVLAVRMLVICINAQIQSEDQQNQVVAWCLKPVHFLSVSTLAPVSLS